MTNQVNAPEVTTSVFALRTVFTACLIARPTSRRPPPAWCSAANPPGDSDPGLHHGHPHRGHGGEGRGYRALGWDDVQALADAAAGQHPLQRVTRRHAVQPDRTGAGDGLKQAPPALSGSCQRPVHKQGLKLFLHLIPEKGSWRARLSTCMDARLGTRNGYAWRTDWARGQFSPNTPPTSPSPLAS